MLAAHLVPGYFAAVQSQKHWHPEWSRNRRIVLWSVAFFGTFAPDLDVIYNGLFRGFLNHSTLWTHSIFVHLGIVFGWLILNRIGRWKYLELLVWFVMVGGLSHLLLDTLVHGVTLLYPFSMRVFVAPFAMRVLEGGFWAYITEPMFIVEPLLFTLALAHWVSQGKSQSRLKQAFLLGLTSAFGGFTVVFLTLLPTWQNIVTRYFSQYH